MRNVTEESSSRSPVLQGGYPWSCVWGAAQWGSKKSGPVGHMGILLELVPVPWKWMDFFYFSHVQDVSYTEEYFYYHSAALSNTQVCISLAGPKNLGKTAWGLWKWLNAPFSPVENIRVWCFMLVPLDCLRLVPEPDGLQTHLHVCCGSLSPLVDKFLSTELFFPWAGPAGRRTQCRNMRAPGEEEDPHPGLRMGWRGTPLLLCSWMKHSPPRSWVRHDSVFIQEKLPARLIATTFALSPAVSPQGLCWCRQRLPVGNANHFVLDKKREAGCERAGGANNHKKTCKKQRP